MYGDHGAINCFESEHACLNSPVTISNVLNDVDHHNVSLALHVGDLSYAVGHGFLWDMWGGIIEPVSSRIPYMVSVGNHE